MSVVLLINNWFSGVKMNNLPENIEIVVNDYINNFNAKLPDLMESFYLVGSIALNDYHEGKSDIDFVCIINRDVTYDETKLIGEIHKEISSKYPKKVLEGSYVTSQQIGKSDIGPVLYFDGKNVRHDDKSGNAGIVTWFMLKKYGITIIGKSPEHYIPYIDVDDLISYVHFNANTYWAKWTEMASKRLSVDSVLTLFEQKVEWGVLGISRLYYTMHEEDIVSKYGAGKYALGRVPLDFEMILKEALRIRKGESKSYYKSPFRRRKDTILFMKYMIRQFQ